MIAFSYPVVPQGKARIRTQMSAAHTEQHRRAIDASSPSVVKVGRDDEAVEMGVVGMKALVKAEAPSPVCGCRTSPSPSPGRSDVLIRVRKTVDLRHRPAHPPLGRVGAGDDPGADGGRPRVHGRDRRARRRGRRARGRASGWPARATSPAVTAATARAGAASSATTTPASASPARGVRRVRRDPGRRTCSSCRRTSPTTSPPVLDPLGNATHTALRFDLVGEDVLITGAGPIGMHGRGDRAPHRRPHTSWSPTSTRTGWRWRAHDRRDRVVDVRSEHSTR